MRIVAFRSVPDLRVAGHGHRRNRDSDAVANGIAGHLEYSAIRRELGKLPPGVTGDAVLTGLSGEQRQGMRILRQKYGERQEDGDRTRGQQANPLSLYYFCKGVH